MDALLTKQSFLFALHDLSRIAAGDALVVPVFAIEDWTRHVQDNKRVKFKKVRARRRT